jgi:hypothetical protein
MALTLSDEVAVCGQLPLAASGQILLAAHNAPLSESRIADQLSDDAGVAHRPSALWLKHWRRHSVLVVGLACR